ncbi:MAG TPA: GNAT family N-acetyltransferase [Longimicrobium sp.]|nr:GNAT family N-acetyltransferase [Longimicrobium sp.]
MIVRPLARQDLAALEPLVAESEADGFHFLRRFHGDWLAGRARADAVDEWFLGVFDGGALVAVGGVTPDPYAADARVGRVRHLYVARAHRRRGLGRRLLAELEARARGVYDLLRLRTDTPEASRFYESLGFAPVESGSATHLRRLRDS